MSTLRQAGFLYQQSPLLAEGRGVVPLELRSRVAAYLRSGTLLRLSSGYYKDWFNPSKSAGKKEYLTDGVWVWPGHFTYYVEEYGLAVPEEFLAYMEAQGWSARKLNEDDLQEASAAFGRLGFTSGDQPPPEAFRRSRKGP